MNILSFFGKYWSDCLVILTLLAAATIGLQRWVQTKWPEFKSMPAAEKIAYITRLLNNLVPIAITLVTNAEIEYGGGTGVLKRSYVIDELYKRIPDEYKKYITEENLDSIINKVLPDAKKIWSENPKINAMVEEF